MAEKTIQEKLFLLQDNEYKIFHQKLIPNIDKNRVIGVRTPILRQYAKEIKNTQLAKDFIEILPHKYYEENNLHAMIIEDIKDYDTVMEKLEKFLPYVDNWATCDCIRPKIFKKYKQSLIIKIDEWLKSNDTYTVRFAIEMLMVYYLDNDFKAEYLQKAADVKSDEYYINMMIAWYFATALAKQYEETFPYIKNKVLSVFVHNKTIQKALESYRIDSSKKELLKSLKIK